MTLESTIETFLSWFCPKKPHQINPDNWLYVYFAQALDCDVPILESLQHTSTLPLNDSIVYSRSRISDMFIKKSWRPRTQNKSTFENGIIITRQRWSKGRSSSNNVYEIEQQDRPNYCSIHVGRPGSDSFTWLDIRPQTTIFSIVRQIREIELTLNL